MTRELDAVRVTIAVIRALKDSQEFTDCPPIFQMACQAALSYVPAEHLLNFSGHMELVHGALRLYLQRQPIDRSTLYLRLGYVDGQPRVLLMHGQDTLPVSPVVRAYPVNPDLIRYFDEKVQVHTVYLEGFRRVLEEKISLRAPHLRFNPP